MTTPDLNKFERRIFDALFPEGDRRREKLLTALGTESVPPETAYWRLQVIDKVFSLEWCRDNIICPLEIVANDCHNEETLLIATGNIAYLATIGEFIKHRASQEGYRVQFTEAEPDIIRHLIDVAAVSGNERDGTVS
ncbi:MAG: hypothetical protein EB072_07510 [Betaproteobacteria bacterium]|nr:hypothetical protein [Betaproteobacteria bacterium]